MPTLKRAVTPIAIVWLGLLVLAGASSADTTFIGTGTVNAVEASDQKINITHAPIPELKWPGMTMDFSLSKNVSVEKIKVGMAVDFELRKEADGSFVIVTLEPAHTHAH
jgi:Cu/Ag efflux protein CusF